MPPSTLCCVPQCQNVKEHFGKRMGDTSRAGGIKNYVYYSLKIYPAKLRCRFVMHKKYTNQYTVELLCWLACSRLNLSTCILSWNEETECLYRLTLFWSRYVRSFTVSGPAGSPLRVLQAARRAVSPLGLHLLTWAPPSTSRRTKRSLPEAAALMRGLQSDRGSPMAWREDKAKSQTSTMLSYHDILLSTAKHQPAYDIFYLLTENII